MKSKKLIKTLEEIAERYFNGFLSDEDWGDSTEYLYYQIHLLEDKIKNQEKQIDSLKQGMRDIETVAKVGENLAKHFKHDRRI
jgi:hypothetical protein